MILANFQLAILANLKMALFGVSGPYRGQIIFWNQRGFNLGEKSRSYYGTDCTRPRPVTRGGRVVAARAPDFQETAALPDPEAVPFHVYIGGPQWGPGMDFFLLSERGPKRIFSV